MCSIDWDECPEVWENRNPKARKAHRCHSCRAPINPGDMYRSVFYVYEGEASSEKQCAPCAVVNDAFVEAHRGGPFPTSLVSMLRECIEGADKDAEDVAPWRLGLAGVMRRRRNAVRTGSVSP